ncbi:MAG TPA: HAMP domain-containing sensor histidine kinase [Phototrophicaceae bacterium]|nr:HAMP domain-containing sensor histidine kinase [Phototrophicaceae bacterium]
MVWAIRQATDMELLTYTEDRRLLFGMAALSLVALLLTAALGLAMTAYVNSALADTYASIVGTVAQKYPQAEAQVVGDLSAPDALSVSLGYQELGKYGLQDLGAAQRGIGAGLLARLLPTELALTGLACAGFALLLAGYRRSIAAQVAGLSAYLRQIEAGDYALDVRDNGEGSFSLLKNDVYKVTVRLREQAELLQKDKTALSNLITDISHQIKTPLTSLGVLADLLAEDPPEEDRRAFVERLRAQLGRIQWLVAALLKLARLDAGTATFKREPVVLRELVRRALEPLQIPLEIKKQRLEVHGDDSASFTGDLNWSAEALTNVIKNCVEHTPEGGKIEIAYAANALYTEITVSDDGEGIASADLPNIFNRFYRGANAGENSVGIGLALAQAIFNAQGGDIAVHSQRGTGTSFEIRLFRGVV